MTDKGDLMRAVTECRAALGEGDPARAEALALAYLEALGEAPQLRGIVGAVRLSRGEAPAALADFQMALKWGGGDADLHYAMGVARQQMGSLDEAAACWRRAVACDPEHVDAVVNGTLAALQGGDWENARAMARHGLTRGMADSRLPLWLGHALAKLHRESEAVEAYRLAVERAPACAEAWFSLALALRDTRQFGVAREALARVLEIDPLHADAGFEAAQLDLMAGRWSQGFALWNWRLRRRQPLLPDDLPGMPWDGDRLPEATLLLQAEQGFGDTLQFLRYAFLAAERVGRVVLRVHAPLLRLLDRPGLPWTAVGLDAPVTAQVHAPLLSLPAILNAWSPCPESAAYLAAGPSPRRRPPRVALVWAGSPAHYNDARRSCRFSAFLTFERVTGVRFMHLQAGADMTEIRRAWPDLEDGMAGGGDFLDTARRLEDCDLVIGVDTAVAHLAGVVGIPAWVLVPAVADWRWGEEGEETPWYPLARVWRQTTPGDWEELLERVVVALAAWRDASGSEGANSGVVS